MKISRIENGNMNDVYLVKLNDNKYIVRTSLFDNTFECKVLNKLKKENIKCPTIITNFKENDRFVMICNYIDGSNPSQMDDEFYKNLANCIKGLHQIRINFKQKEYFSNEETLDKLDEYYQKAINSKYLKDDIEVVNRMYSSVKNLKLSQFKKCIVHSDIKRENIIQNGSDVYLIDFGNCYVGSRLIDVIRTIMWFFISKNNYNYGQIKIFIDVYFFDFKLSKYEKTNFNKLFDYCLLYNLLKDIFLYENCILKKEYIENNSLIWLDTIKNMNKVNKIKEMIINA